MPQFWTHLLILIALIRHIRIYVQEWSAWQIMYIYASLYSLCVIFFYSIYFFLFLRWEPPYFLTIFSWFVCILALIHILIIGILRVKSEEDTIIWIWASMYGLQRRKLILTNGTKAFPFSELATYNYFNAQANTWTAQITFISWVIAKTHCFCLYILFCIGSITMPEMTDFCCEWALYFNEGGLDAIESMAIAAFVLAIIVRYIFLSYKPMLLNDLYLPGMLYQYKYHYEQPTYTLKVDIISRHIRYSPRRLPKLYNHLYSSTPGYNKNIQYISDVPMHSHNMYKIISIDVPMQYIYTNIRAIRIWVSQLLNFSTEQRSKPIFILKLNISSLSIYYILKTVPNNHIPHA